MMLRRPCSRLLKAVKYSYDGRSPYIWKENQLRGLEECCGIAFNMDDGDLAEAS